MEGRAVEKKSVCRDTTDLVVRGHELWLELSGSHGHAGSHVELRLKWGHNMQVDGLVRKEGLEAFVVGPGGETEKLAVEETGDNFYLVRFFAKHEGFYHVVAARSACYVLDGTGNYLPGTRRKHPEAARAVLYRQFAQVFVPVGHDLEGVPREAGLTLEVRAPSWRQWRVGDEISFRLLFRGAPLEGAAVDVASSGPGGYRQWVELTGTGGGITLKPQEPGHYLLVARHEVPEGEEGVYDAVSLTATLYFIVTR